nr:tyrosine-type recombinase/integrase [uncultured Celeribacter sp.]
MDEKLSATFVKNIKKPGVYSDKSGLGLRLRVKPDGRKHWLQRYTRNGKTREAGLGSYPVVTLKMARETALENHRLLHVGKDPIAEKHKRQRALSFQEAVDEYLAAKLAEFRNEKHRKQWRSTLDNYATPVLGPLPLETISVYDVMNVLTPIWESKTETASRLRQRLEAVFSWATVQGLREGQNPATWKGNLSELLPKPGKVKTQRHHAAVRVQDAPAFWKTLVTREGIAAQALQFLCLTASRSGEVRGMTWDEVDFEKRLWIIPKERMKAGREHRVPLPDLAVDLLCHMPRLRGCNYVFFSTKGTPLSDMAMSAVMRRIDEDAKAKGTQRFLDPRSGRPAVPHGLRSTFRDWAAETGVDHVVAEMALAHHVGSTVERAYRRSDLVEKRREVLECWRTFLSQ